MSTTATKLTLSSLGSTKNSTSKSWQPRPRPYTPAHVLSPPTLIRPIPTPDGLLPGNGALVAAVATAGKVEPIVAGKPYQPFADLIHGRVGTHAGDLTNRERHVVVGDLPSTDGLLASRLGFEFALVLTGVTSLEESETCEPRPDTVHPDLASLGRRPVEFGSGNRTFVGRKRIVASPAVSVVPESLIVTAVGAPPGRAASTH